MSIHAPVRQIAEQPPAHSGRGQPPEQIEHARAFAGRLLTGEAIHMAQGPDPRPGAGSMTLSELRLEINTILSSGEHTPYSIIQEYSEARHGVSSGLVLAKGVNDLFVRFGVLAEGEQIRDHQHAVELMQAVRYKPGVDPEMVMAAIAELQNGYNLNLGNRELLELNKIEQDRHVNAAEYDYVFMRRAFLGEHPTPGYERTMEYIRKQDEPAADNHNNGGRGPFWGIFDRFRF